MTLDVHHAVHNAVHNAVQHIAPERMSTFTEDVGLMVAAFAIFGIIDLLFIRFGWLSTDKNGRYFSLHVLCNAYVTIVHFDDVVKALSDPSNAAFGPCDNSGTSVMMALHFYHIAFYRPLDAIDWIHHILMVVLLTPLAYAVQPGHVLGLCAFFVTGLPGGLDYIMLVCVKKGWMRPLTEKRLNAHIQTWLRAPGCIINAMMIWITWIELIKREKAGVKPLFNAHSYITGDYDLYYVCLPVMLINIAALFWNGTFFARRVVESYTRHMLKSRAAEAARDQE